MKNTVIYHRADFDGIFCREIAKKFLQEPTLIGWDYGDELPEVSPDCRLYMLDISVDGLMEHPNLIWIDHHKSAMEKFSADIHGYRIDGVAACRLAFQWFALNEAWDPREQMPPYALPSKDAYVERRVAEPFAVRLAGEYDIWDKRDPRAELFQHGLRSRELGTEDWMLLLREGRPNIAEIESMMSQHLRVEIDPDGTTVPAIVAELLKNGEAIQHHVTKQNESIIKAAGFTIEFEGFKFLACNHARYNSHLFTAGLTDEHDACFGFNWDGKQWRVSLYHAPGKEHHDLSPIAVKHGGGGHRGACGFRTVHLPFLS
jgi:hypothetical protein